MIYLSIRSYLQMGIPSFYITASDHIARWAFHHFISQHQIILPDGHSIILYHSIRSISDEQSIFFHRLRLTLGDMFKNEVPQNHEIGPERGPGGSVWAETLSKWRPGPQDHFPNPPGPKNLIKQKNKKKSKVPGGRRQGAKPLRFAALRRRAGRDEMSSLSLPNLPNLHSTAGPALPTPPQKCPKIRPKMQTLKKSPN